MTGTLTIRPSTGADLAELDALFARAYPRLLKPDYPPSVLVTALPLISRAQPALVRSGRFYVAEAAGAIVGAGGWSGGRRGVAEIRHVVTDDRQQRCGIGRAIFARIFDEARAAGVTRLDANATRTAVPFYRAMGFAVLGPVEVALRLGIVFPAVRMQREI